MCPLHRPEPHSPSLLGPVDVIFFVFFLFFFCVSLPRRGRRWFRARLPRRKGGGRPLHPSSPVGEAPRAWTPSLWTKPCERSGGADCQRGPFKSHEPETLRNPRAIRSRRSVSLCSSCRARPALRCIGPGRTPKRSTPLPPPGTETLP